MIKLIKRLLFVLLIGCSFLFFSCKKETVNNEPVSMYVGLGNTNSDYYKLLKQYIKEDLGIDVKFVYTNMLDTSTSVLNQIKNQDLPADIVITASTSASDYVSDCFLDLASNTNIPDLFTNVTVKQFSDNGKVYWLPFSTLLTGITYNQTLFDEMGWDVPHTFNDMVELKKKADEAGYKFAVCGGVATGHGFNYLLNLMGTQYISTPDGTSWLEDFLSGKCDSSSLKNASTYLKKYYEAGLFGSYHDEDWQAAGEFQKERALFYYENTNMVYSYSGLRYTEDGLIYGATYNGEEVVSRFDANGRFVKINGTYQIYDETNFEHFSLDRYEIDGAVILNDTYKSMPYISENGENNCYVTFDNMIIGLNKNLLKSENQKQFNDAVKILEYMTTDKISNLYSNLYQAGYVAVKSYNIDESRLYSNYKSEIKNGFIMPWYYGYFDLNTVVAVGGAVNSYLSGKGGSFDDIFTTFDEYQSEHLSGNEEVLCEFMDEFNYSDSAKFQCVAEAYAMNSLFSENKLSYSVDVAMMAYTDSLDSLPYRVNIPVVCSKVYKGSLLESHVQSLITSTANKVCAVKLTGSKIKELASAGFDANIDYNVTDVPVFKIIYVTKGDMTLIDDKEYVVTLPQQLLTNEMYEELFNNDKVIKISNSALIGKVENGIRLFAKDHKTLSKSDLKF